MNNYNFSVREMINNFSLDEFLVPQNEINEKEAFLLITDEQYLLGYSKCNGCGDFNEAISNSIREIYNLNDFTYRREIDNISNIAKKHFISARIVNSKKAGVYFLFNMKDCKSITENQFKLLEQFYEKNNDTIKYYSETLGYPIVKYSLSNKNPSIDDYGMVLEDIHYDSNDLDSIMKYFKSIVDENKTCPKDEVIVGESLNQKKLTR